MPIRRQEVPNLAVETLAHGRFELAAEDSSRGTPLFPAPGLFVVNPDQTLYAGSVQTMPFARPSFAELLGALDFVIAKDYPARGEFTGPV